MRLTKTLILTSAFLFAGATAIAQPPGGERGGQPPRGGERGGERGGQRGGDREQTRPADGDLVTRMMAFDKDKDGKLKKDEVTDERLTRLFDRADANKDGTVTKEELEAVAKEDVGRGGPGGPGGRGGPGGFGGGRGGFGGPGGPGGFTPPKPGEVLPLFLVEQLKLSADQKKQLAELQKETDAKLEKLLTDDQKKTLKEMKDRGPMGGPGGPGGPGRGGDR
jgi:hypothetical protein